MRTTLLSIFLLLATLGVAQADPHGDCDSRGQPALGIVQVTGGTADSTVYVDDRNFVFGNGIWTYVESNGIWTPKLPGVYLQGNASSDLQRGSYICVVPCDKEICMDDSTNGPDTALIL